MQFKTKLTVLFISLIMIPVTLAMFVAVSNTEKVVTHQAVNQLESLANSKKSEFEIFINSQEELLAGVTSRTKLRSTIEEYNDSPSTEAQVVIKEILTDAKTPFAGVNWIAVYDSRGDYISSSYGVAVQNTASLRSEVITNEGIYLYFDFNHGIVTAPIIREGVVLGYGVYSFNLDLLRSVVEDYTGLGETGEILVAQRNKQGDAEFLNTRRFGRNTNARGVVSKDSFDAPITQALLKNEATYLNGIDYRGEPVLATTRYLEGVDWGLVVKIDDAEIRGSLTEFRSTIVVISLIIIVFTAIIAFIVSRSLTQPIEALTNIAKEVEQGNMNVEIPSSIRTDQSEIGLLATTFNSMISSIRGLKESLEEKVRMRTVELETASQKLEEKLHETERLNKLMIGRELKMTEMKKKLKRIK